MYKYLFSLLIIAGLFNSCGPTHIVFEEHPYQPAPPPPPPEQEAPYQEFYDQLAPYGQWIDYPGYGYVFMPNVGPDFKPYSTNGHWVYTDEGWTWASEYNWGWAAFHYGRWFFEDGYGWMWIPGHEWAPAWVSWRRSPDYYGWAPLGPGVSINVSIGGGYNPPAHYWSFVQPQYITHPHVNNYYVNESRNVTIINNTTVINNTVINNNVTNNVNNTTINHHVHNNYAGGPDTHEVERMTGAPVRPVAIQENNRPGEQLNNNQLAIYRPRGNAGQPQNAAMKPAPPAVVHLNQARPATTIRYNNGSAPMQNNAPAPPQRPNNNNGFNRPGNPINNNNTTVVPPAPDNNRPIRNFRPGNTAPTPVTNNTPITNPPPAPPASTPMRPPANNPAMQPPNNNNPGNNKYLPGRPAQPQQTVVPPASNNNNNPPNNRYMPGRPVQQQQETMKLPPDHKTPPAVTPPANTPPPRPMPAPRDPNKDLPKKPEPHKDDRNNN